MTYVCLDLFSGIGGFALAFRDCTRVVAYCENDPFCCEILRSNMRRGLIDTANIFPDVISLKGSDLRHKVDMLTAGFPCQDISQANPAGRGLQGNRSGLVKHVFRLIDELKTIHLVILENSPFIKSRGLDQVLYDFTQRGFQVAWSNFDSLHDGLAMKRVRWFCMAYKKKPNIRAVNLLPLPLLPSTRVAIKEQTTCKVLLHRCRRLGNAVVPQTVVRAFNMLAQAADSKHDPLMLSGNLDMLAYQKVCLCQDVNNLPTRTKVTLPFISLFKLQPELHLSDGVTHITKPYWASPNASAWHQYHNLTDRSSRLLSNMIFYERHTQAYVRQHDKVTPLTNLYSAWIVSPAFVEALMGYCEAYTKLE